MRRERHENFRPRGALRTPVSIRLEFAHWKALQDFRELGLMQTTDDYPAENDAAILQANREHRQ